jgi:ketosteroid isomerase-like protein
MRHPHLELIDTFFAAYGSRDEARLHQVLAEGATWHVPGHHPLAGTLVGRASIIAFFDQMGSVIGSSEPTIARLVTGASDTHVIECQHIRTNRPGTPNLDQQICVLWGFENGQIISGRHLIADQAGFDAFFTHVLG